MVWVLLGVWEGYIFFFGFVFRFLFKGIDVSLWGGFVEVVGGVFFFLGDLDVVVGCSKLDRFGE